MSDEELLRALRVESLPERAEYGYNWPLMLVPIERAWAHLTADSPGYHEGELGIAVARLRAAFVSVHDLGPSELQYLDQVLRHLEGKEETIRRSARWARDRQPLEWSWMVLRRPFPPRTREDGRVCVSVVVLELGLLDGPPTRTFGGEFGSFGLVRGEASIYRATGPMLRTRGQCHLSLTLNAQQARKVGFRTLLRPADPYQAKDYPYAYEHSRLWTLLAWLSSSLP